MTTLYILIFMTTVYAGDVTAVVPFKFGTEAACKNAGELWKAEAHKQGRRYPNYVCLPDRDRPAS